MSRLHSLSTTRRSPLSRRGRAGLAVAAVVAVVTPLAAACGAGFDSASLVVKPNSGAGSVGPVKVNNVWVVVDPETRNAEVIGAVDNTAGNTDLSWPTVQVGGSIAQVEAASDAGGSASASASALSSASGSNASDSASGIPAGQAVSFGEKGQPQLRLPDSSLTPGSLTQVTFSFGSIGNVTVTAQVQSNTGLFADYNPDNPASASGVPSGGASGSASANPLGGAASSPSGNPTSSVSASPADSSSPTPTTK